MYAVGKDIRLVNLGPTVSFSKYKLTTSSRKHLEDISHAQIVPLMYQLITSSEDSMIFLVVLIKIEEGDKES